MTNIKKHNNVRSKLNKEDDDFEKKFMSRGNSSIKKEMLRHEKNSKSPKNQDHHSLYSGNNLSKNLLLSKPSKRYNFRTEIKEFSINLSEADLSLGNIAIEEAAKKEREEK